MIIDRRPSRYPRRGGPSCLGILLVLAGAAALLFMGANANAIMEAVVPTPTAEPTRSAASYATSAALYQRDKDYDKAIASYESAITLDMENTQYYVALINLLTQTGNAEQALYWAERVQLLSRDDDRVLTAVAATYLLNGGRLGDIGQRAEAELQYQRAVDTASRAIQINPNNANAYAYLAGATIRQDRNNFAVAQEMANTALALNPESAVVRYYRGMVLENQGQYKLAIEEYEMARELDPNYLDPALSLAYNYFYSDNRARAINILRELIEANPVNADAYDALGWMYFLAGQYPDAERYLQEAVKLDPELTRAKAHLGSAYYKNFNYDQAIPMLEEAVAVYQANYDNGIPLTDSTSLYFVYLGFAYYRTDAALCNKAEPLLRLVIEAMGPDSFRGQDAQVGLDNCRQATLGE
jgi:tetratricopeptide (TPR) repeat protein